MNVDKVINGNQCTDAARAAENAGIRSSGFAIATGDPDKLLGILSRGRGEWGRG